MTMQCSKLLHQLMAILITFLESLEWNKISIRSSRNF